MANAFGNALGNAAIAGIEEANAHNATKQAQASIEINPGSPQLQVSDINMPLAAIAPANVDYTVQSGDTLSGSLAARQAFVAQVEAKGGPAIDPTTASSSDWADYVSSYSHLGESPAGAQTLGEMVVTPDYSYVKASPAENAYFASMNRYLDSVSVDPAETARVNAARAQQSATDLASQRALDALQAQDEQYLATLPYQIGKGAFKSVVNSFVGFPQQIWNGLKEYGAYDMDMAAAAVSLSGHDADAAQLSSAADAERADALRPVAVPFTNLSPEENLGGYTLAGLSLFFGNPEAVGLVRGVGAADGSIGALDAFSEASDAAAIDEPTSYETLPTFTFRGDTRSPEEIFNEGFTPRGTSTDLLAHALDNTNPPSAFVPTSGSFDVASSFANNVYVIRPVNGIDVNATLGAASPYPWEQEIAVFGRISPSNIRGVTKVDEGVSILNPYWNPSSGK